MSSKVILRRRRKIPQWKIEEVRNLRELLLKHNVVAIADMTGIGSKQLFFIRKSLRGKAILRVSKNTLLKIAIKQVANQKPGIENLIDYLHGQNIFIFTDMNPFELSIFLDKNKASRPARPGDIAQEDIVVPAGSTGLPPGPIMSKFSKLRIPVRIEEGVITIVKDTVVARKGDVISEDLADVLSRLGIEPIKVGLKLKAAYVDGKVLTEKDLKLDIKMYENLLKEAVTNAYKLSITQALPVKETITFTVMMAYSKALALAYQTIIPLPEPLKYAIIRAVNEANILAKELAPKCPELGIKVGERKEEKETIKEEEKKEEKLKEEGEEEVYEGLSALF